MTKPTDSAGKARSLSGRADFHRMWAADTISYFGTAVSAVALPILAVEELGASTLEVGIISASGVVSWLLFGLFAGVWIDRRAKRPLLILCDLVRAAALFSVPLVAAMDMLTIPYLVGVAATVGFASVFFDIASQTYLPAVIESKELVAGNSKLQVSDTAAQTAGPAVGGALVQTFGAVTSLFVDAFSYLLSAVLLGRIRKQEVVRVPKSSAVWPQIREGLVFVWRDPVFRPLMLVAVGLNFLGRAFDTLLVPFLLHEFDLSPGEVGLALAIGGVGALAGSALGPLLARRFGEARSLWIAAFAGPPLGLLVPLSDWGPQAVLFAIGLLAREAGIAMFSLLARSIRQITSPPELLARVTATIKFVSWGVLPFGALAGGALGQFLGERAAMVVFSLLLLLVGAPLLFVSMKDVQNQVDAAHRQAAAQG
ncbi:MFS transporter [Streptomyces rubiginosohelvolus]|uniref:MFS transporter n=1 Tax=Streptomyces rubiginosohelvolus TaxID=67362 RepID=UPI0036C2BABA